jgi:septum site-determining protein MinD
VVPEDEGILVSSNRGAPAAMEDRSRAGQAFRDIARRLKGEEVPFLPLEDQQGFLQKLMSRLAR